MVNGTFGLGDNGSGALVMGTEIPGELNMYGGTITVGGTSGISVYQNAVVNLTSNGTFFDDDGESYTGGSITIEGKDNAIALETNYEDGATAASVTINGGSYVGGQDGIWYGNSVVSLSIESGEFTGDSRSGLYFDVAPEGNHVQINAGTFTGHRANSNIVRWEWWECHYEGGGIGAKATLSSGTITSYVDVTVDQIIASGSTIYNENNDVINLTKRDYPVVRELASYTKVIIK